MRNFAKKVEVAANIAIIVVAVLLVAALTKQYLFPALSQNPAERVTARKVPKSGDPVALTDVD